MSQFICADRFYQNSLRLQFSCRGLNIFNRKSQVTQTFGFRITSSFAIIRKGKELNLIFTGYRQIQFIRIPFLPICLPDNIKAQYFRIKRLTFLIIIGQDRYMMNCFYFHKFSV